MLTSRVGLAAALCVVGAALGCSSTPIGSEDTPFPLPETGGSGGSGSGGSSGGGSGGGVVPAADYGLGDGSLASVVLTELYRPQLRVALSATALAFNPTVEGELWVTLRQFPSGKPCANSDTSGCAALPGAVAVMSQATGAEPSTVLKEDGNSLHFMRRPTAIAWGEGDLFASCGEAWTDNFEDVDVPYAGPVLWSSDPAVFGVEPTAAQNGTHLDMLHETPYCMGIAHESGNAYWAVNGDVGALDRYDFHVPHQIGGEDHRDGEVHRYIEGQLSRVPEVPSHAAYDSKRKRVYVADTGNARVLSVDPAPATRAGDIPTYETLQASGQMVGATVVELVAPGSLVEPSGLALVGDVLYVTDSATSIIYAFDTSGQLLRQLPTELPAGSLAGVAVGPDQKVYFTDLLTGSVTRIDPL